MMTYDIWYGTACAVDKFGFVRGGKIAIGPDSVELYGNRHWPVIPRVGVFLAITILPAVMIGFGLGFLVALIVIHYFCASPGAVTIPRSTVDDIVRSGRAVSFTGSLSEDGRRRRSLFKTANGQEAERIVVELIGEA